MHASASEGPGPQGPGQEQYEQMQKERDQALHEVSELQQQIQHLQLALGATHRQMLMPLLVGSTPKELKLYTLCTGLFGAPPVQHQAMQKFIRLLSTDSSFIDAAIQLGALPKFVELLNRSDSPELQFEAACALTSISSGTLEHIQAVLDAGAVPILVQLLSSPHDDVHKPAVWALGNIAGASHACRDMVLSLGALAPLLDLINADIEDARMLVRLQRTTFTLSNLCRGKPAPPFQQMCVALPTLARLINHNNEEVVIEACWALACLADGDSVQIGMVLRARVCRRLVELLTHPSQAVVTPALRAVGNIVTGNDIQTQTAIECGVLPRLNILLKCNHKKRIQREACRAVANITRGQKDQIQAVFDANLLAPLLHLLSSAEPDVQKQAALAVSHAAFNGAGYQIRALVDAGCIKIMCAELAVEDQDTVMALLQGLESILKTGERGRDSPAPPANSFWTRETSAPFVNPYARLVAEAQGEGEQASLKNLLDHPHEPLRKKALCLMQTYFPEKDGLPRGALA